MSYSAISSARRSIVAAYATAAPTLPAPTTASLSNAAIRAPYALPWPSRVGEFVHLRGRRDVVVIRVIVQDVIADLFVVLEAQLAIRAGVRELVHVTIVSPASDGGKGHRS